MANIGTFTAQDNGYTGTVRTLTLNVKVKFIPNEKDNDKSPDYRIVVGGYEIGAAWRKVSKQDRPYLSKRLRMVWRAIGLRKMVSESHSVPTMVQNEGNRWLVKGR